MLTTFIEKLFRKDNIISCVLKISNEDNLVISTHAKS